MVLQRIERIERPTPLEFYQNYIKPNRPVVLTGITDRWSAISTWTPDYLRSHYPAARVAYTTYDNTRPNNDPENYYATRRRLPTTIGEFVDSMNASADFSNYVSQFPILNEAPELKNDIDSLEPYMNIPQFYPNSWRRKLQRPATLWLGPAGIVTPVHFDSAHNLLVQIHGRKKLLLVPPAQSRALYYPSLRLGHVNYSPVDLEAPDYDRYPLFKDATPLEVTLMPGDVLFIPVRWWHYARALDKTISLNFWWFSIGSARRMWHPYLVYKTRRWLSHKEPS